MSTKYAAQSNELSIQSDQCHLPGCISDTVSVLDCISPTAQDPWSFTPSYSEISCNGLRLAGDFKSGDSIQATYSLGKRPTAITMKFRITSIGEVDEYVRVTADGQVVYQIPIQSKATQLSGSCNNSCLSGEIRDIQFGFNYSSETLNLQIDSTIPSTSNSVWSICGIELELQDCPVWTDGSCINAVIFDSIKEFSCSNPVQSYGWKYYPQFATYQSGMDTFVGRFGGSGKLIGRYALPSTHESIFLSFSLNFAYGWQGDAVRMFADGAEILHLTVDPQRLTYSEANDNSITQHFFTEFNHNKNSLSIAMDSTIQGDNEGESWGICDLLISVNQCPLGLFWNPSSTQCETDCPAGKYSDTQTRTCLECTSSTCISNTNHEELSCRDPDLSFWRINGQSNIEVDSSGSDFFVGRYGQGDTVSKAFYSLPAHESINLKVKLFTIGPWNGELFTINIDGRTIYSQEFNHQHNGSTDSDVCLNDIVETAVSVRFAHVDNQLVIEFSSSLSSTQAKWGICGLEFTLLNCPYGEYYDPNEEKCVQACSNAGSEDEETGACSSDVISPQPTPNETNSTSTSPSTPTNSTPTTSNPIPSNPTNTSTPRETILIDLIGEKMRIVEWIISGYYTTVISIFEGHYYFGGFTTSTTIQRSYTLVTVLESIHLYFRFYIINIWIEQIFWIKVNGQIIFMYEINGSNRYWDFEVQFEHREKIISLEFGVSGGHCEGLWGISDLLIHSNQCQNGFVYCPVRKSCIHSGLNLINSLILVQQQYIYRAAVGIPCWISHQSSVPIVYGIGNHQLVSIIDGINQIQFKPGNYSELLVKNTQTGVIQYTTDQVCAHKNGLDYFGWLIIDLTEYHFLIEEWIFKGTASRGSTWIEGYKSLGPIDFSTTISRILTGPSFYSSITIRFRIWIIELWIEELFWIEVNSVRIFETKISGKNTYRDIELQFDNISPQLPLVFGCTKGLGTSVFKSWAISDFAIYFNPCPTYYVFDASSMTCRKATQSIFTSIFTQHLDTIYMTTKYQVCWLVYILQWQFVEGTEIYGWYTKGHSTVVTSTVQWNSVITQSTSVVTSYQAGRIQYELCGSAMDVTKWIVDQPSISGSQVKLFQGGSYYYGDFKTGQTIISKQIYVQSTVKWISLKFFLYLIEIWEGGIFWIELNKVRIFEYSMTGVNIRKLVTVYFENIFQEQYLTLTFGSSTINTKVVSQGSWGISDLAIHHNPCSMLSYFDSGRQQCLNLVETQDIFELLYTNSINDIEIDSRSVYSTWWTSKFESTTYTEKIICSYRENSTRISIHNTQSAALSTLTTSSGHTSVSTYTRTSISSIHTELCRQYERTNGWLLDGANTSLESVLVGNHFSFGPFQSTSVVSKGYSVTSVYKSVTLRFILYIFVEYFNEIFWITSSGYKIFSSTLKSTSGPLQIEVQFPHTTSFLDLRMGFSSQSDFASRLQWGISDLFIYSNPCKVGSYFDQTSRACQVYHEDSIFYAVFWQNQQNHANLPQNLPIWFNDIQLNQGMVRSESEIITTLREDLTYTRVEKVLYSSTNISTTTTQVQSYGFANYQILTDLIGTSYEISSWTSVANSQQIVRTQTGSQCYLGSFTGDTQITRSWNLVSLHFTVSIRFRLYLVGEWDWELFWVKSGSDRVFQVWVSGQNTYKDIELQFDHYTQQLQLTFGTAASSRFQWAISDIAVLTNRCSQQNFLNSECDYVGKSVFYALVQQAGRQILQTEAGEPAWLSKLLDIKAPSNPSVDYYGFYNSTIRVIEGDQEVSQTSPPSFDPFDFETYLKNQIQSNQAQNNTADSTSTSLSFAEGKASIGIIFEKATGLIRCYESNINNMFGQSLLVAGITQLQITIQADFGRTCFGVIETDDFNLLPIDTDITSSSMVACSDGSYFNMQKSGNLIITSGGAYTLTIDPDLKTVTITGETGSGSYIGTFTDPSKLFYTLQFNQQASVNLDIMNKTTIQQVSTQVVHTIETVETVHTSITHEDTAKAASKFKNLRGLRV